MEEIKEFIRINELLARYGKLLTDKQQEIMQLYFGLDYSLQEISDNLHISRAAISDAIKQATAHLEKYEEVLKLNERSQKVAAIVEALQKQDLTKKQLALIARISEEL